MSRYVDADGFLKRVKEKAHPQSGSVNESERKISLYGIVEILTEMSTVDIVPKEEYDALRELYTRLLESASILSAAVDEYQRREENGEI